MKSFLESHPLNLLNPGEATENSHVVFILARSPKERYVGPGGLRGCDKMHNLKLRVKGQATIPDKLMADGAKRGLWEKGGGELMALDMMDFGLFDGSSTVMQSEEAFSLKFTHVLCVCRRG